MITLLLSKTLANYKNVKEVSGKLNTLKPFMIDFDIKQNPKH